MKGIAEVKSIILDPSFLCLDNKEQQNKGFEKLLIKTSICSFAILFIRGEEDNALFWSNSMKNSMDLDSF